MNEVTPSKMKFKKIFHIVTLVALLATGLPLMAARHAVVYNSGTSSWTDLGTLPGDTYLRGLAINSGGTAVGQALLPTTPSARAFSYSGSMSELAELGTLQDYCEATGINTSGQIVGMCAQETSGGDHPTYAPPHAVVWNSGAITDIDTSGSSGFSLAHAINDAGTIVGESLFGVANMRAVHAFKYVSGTTTDLGTLGGPESVAYSINTGGTIAGTSQTASDGWHLFKYSGSTMTDLGKPPLSGCSSVNGDFPVSIDDSSNIAGTSCLQSWYYDTSFHIIPVLSGDTASEVYSISNGVVVGWGLLSRHPWSFTISGAVMVDLGTAKTDGGSWDWVDAMAISSSGQIVGFAGLNSDI
jgi:probable HAF family extracellular repeat protein